VLFNYPLLYLFNSHQTVLGIPALYAYPFDHRQSLCLFALAGGLLHYLDLLWLGRAGGDDRDRIPADLSRADRDRIIQVMLNLLSNAVKFVAPGIGRVVVRLRNEPGALRVDVEDNGCGIDLSDSR